jgi:hypothetical protein
MNYRFLDHTQVAFRACPEPENEFAGPGDPWKIPFSSPRQSRIFGRPEPKNCVARTSRRLDHRFVNLAQVAFSADKEANMSS